jgi:hypothetical protein
MFEHEIPLRARRDAGARVPDAELRLPLRGRTPILLLERHRGLALRRQRISVDA